MTLEEHPAVRRHKEKQAQAASDEGPIDAAWLRDLCLACGADDVGFVGINRPEIASQAFDIASVFPKTKALISIVCRMNREPVRSPQRSVANQEFHETYDHVNNVARKITRMLEDRGIRALNLVSAFPMEVGRTGKGWIVGHKPIAEAAGMGKMGLHRSVIHPKFGSFILLDTVLVGREISEESKPLDYAPCLDCKLCVAACPVEAIGQNGSFNFSACYTHNYRDFLGNFVDWTGHLADSKNRQEFRERVSDGENITMWQSLSFKPGYKAAYCMSVCPAGEDVIGPYLDDRIAFTREFLQPLQAKEEIIYVLPRSDAETLVPKRYPHKEVKLAPWAVNTSSDPYSFFFGLTLTFQKRRSKGLEARFDFNLTGDTPVKASMKVSDQTLSVEFVQNGPADVTLNMPVDCLLHMMDRDFDLGRAIASGQVNIEGDAELVEKLIDCFPEYGDIEYAS
ncbi:MAG: 4Fe-4S ferredoxin [Rhizobiales bacterium]|nr:4Fe-4S ferredoxin [Hyphomicrobiales bacterium]